MRLAQSFLTTVLPGWILALDLINELNDKVGKSDLRENYKYQILQQPEYQSVERINLTNQINLQKSDNTNLQNQIIINLNKEIGDVSILTSNL